MNGSAIGTACRAVACGFVALLLAGLGLFRVAIAQSQEPAQTSLATPSGVVASFSLVDQHGQPVTDKDFRGSFMLVYFGYTYCPDVCPLGLQRMSEAVKALGPNGERVVPIFVTVDPERDTSKVLAAYTSHFHPRLIGLTGAREQIDAAKRAYGVRGFKLFPPPSFDDEDSERENESDDGDNSRYLMQHSASTYLVGPDGRIESIFPHEISSREMAGQLEVLVRGNP
jgi:protein SCO1/2